MSVPIDARNGLRAGSGCPPAHVVRRDFEAFDGPLAAWAAGAERTLAPTELSPLCPDHGDGAAGRLRIGYPHDGARFLLDPDRALAQQQVAVRVEAPGRASTVDLSVDGRVVARGGAPYVLLWGLERGAHELRVSAPGMAQSAPVHVRVD